MHIVVSHKSKELSVKHMAAVYRQAEALLDGDLFWAGDLYSAFSGPKNTSELVHPLSNILTRVLIGSPKKPFSQKPFAFEYDK